MAKILAPDFEFFGSEAELISELCQCLSKAVRVKVGQACVRECVLKNLPDRRSIAPMFAREANGGKLMIRSFCDLRRRKQGSSLPQSFSFRRKLTQSATILRMSSPTGKKQVIKVLLRF